MGFRQNLYRFMQGRNGMDTLSKVSLVTSFVILILSTFFRSGLLYLAALCFLGYSFFRVMSRNTSGRYKENQKFVNFFYGIKNIGKPKAKSVYKIFKCPGCGQKVRVPRHRGKIEITCPKCKRNFVKRT